MLGLPFTRPPFGIDFFWIKKSYLFSQGRSIFQKPILDKSDKNEKLISLLTKDKNEFIVDIVDTRNYLTHYDDENKGKAKKGLALFRLTEKVKLLRSS
jgi:hypothetical protein